MSILIKNIKTLFQTENRNQVSGAEMANLPSIENAWISTDNDTISGFGSMDNMPTNNFDTTIDATGKFVLPAWCDSHTHLVFAASREEEFVYRIKGMSYEEIAAKGGGILNSAAKTEKSSEEELYQSALVRLQEIAKTGTGAVEIKSGYGLSVEAEIKMLRVIKRLKENSPLTIKATFLGAHAIPKAYKQDRAAYIDLVINEMLPIIDKEGLADYIDVFCETNYYTPEETNKVLEAGAKYGLLPKIHVNQFTSIGGIEAGIKNNALSVDHLEVMTEADIEDIRNSNVIPTVLPSCSFFLNIPYAPARELIDKGLPLALATDFNPGSTPSGNIPFVLSLACINMKMLPEETINAVTINAANAMGLGDTHGTITVGKTANLLITKELPSIAALPYYFGNNPVEITILNGKIN